MFNDNELSNTLRKDSLALIFHAESGHPGGVLSAIDVFSYLWTHELSYALTDESYKKSRFVLSKGHAVAMLYAAAGRSGLFAPSLAPTLRQLNSPLQGHPHVLDTPWVETSTGSLGQGFSVALGMAIGYRAQKIDTKMYAMLGDGELQEGEVWEALMCGAHHALSNLCCIIDYNKLQSDDTNKNIMNFEPLLDKLVAFGWHVIDIDGHNEQDIAQAIEQFKSRTDKPTTIIANTVKGKGVSFMEANPAWHGSVKIRVEELTSALVELKASPEEIERYISGHFWGAHHA